MDTEKEEDSSITLGLYPFLIIVICSLTTCGEPDLIDAVSYRLAPELFKQAEE